MGNKNGTLALHFNLPFNFSSSPGFYYYLLNFILFWLQFSFFYCIIPTILNQKKKKIRSWSAFDFFFHYFLPSSYLADFSFGFKEKLFSGCFVVCLLFLLFYNQQNEFFVCSLRGHAKWCCIE